MYIVVYELSPSGGGGKEERPLAMFRNPMEAKVFLKMVTDNGRTAYTKMI